MNQILNITTKDNHSVSRLIEKRTEAHRHLLKNKLPELVELERILLQAKDIVTVRINDYVEHEDLKLPIYTIELGNFQPAQPRLLIVGGVHGIERIGSRVVIALLSTWIQRMGWEKSLQHCLENMSITFVPIVNPKGMLQNTRSNGNHVDLMRNAPIDAEGKVPFLIGGQRISKHISWFRGSEGSLEKENQILEEVVNRLCQDSPLVISLDCHSGFGFRDRVWFPYAYRRRPMKGIAPIMALKLLWDSGYPNHQYIFEPQSNHYLTHGDFWDYCYKKFSLPPDNHNFIPLTLEMGSWNWVKKKPSQLLSMEGLFNPMAHHRQQRTLRRHLPLLDFLRHATFSYSNWFPEKDQFNQLRQMANSLWYREN
ncbi:DUF2817 domain-containing protein [Aliikangiella coralliicola]|uniref:DUF2817 domain-containing protein n=1 Tax=Aliikangiella coralliicola TaxID=2592383 RepID=A0A545UCG2_9GAMM|nr:DUF2817 domain-containing protein [Aliikangiella coralliicola]TQV87150.1 DUF2817 domain-containing protein [Aliikangiella coralliicola]